MKKTTFVAMAMLATSVGLAQQKKDKEPPPPPPPPVMNVEAPKPPPPPAPPTKPKEEPDAFLNRNPTVKAVTWTDETVDIYLKSGKHEVYDMKNEKDVQALREKYGEFPTPPPPPPPPPAPVKDKTVS
jgi:hypothetical protein